MGPTGIAAGDGFQDGEVSLLDVRFSHDILVFAKSFEEIGRVLEMLVGALRQVGFVPNAGKRAVSTMQSQHPAERHVQGGNISGRKPLNG